MTDIRRISTSRWGHKKKHWILFGFFLFLVFVRISKGSFYKNFYYFISKPFWPGQFQKEIILESLNQESSKKLNLLKKDNIRLREILNLQESSNKDAISAAVISRKTGGWWRQLILNKGSKDGVEIGSVVIGPGGLLGRVKSTSLLTSSVTLLTSPESKVGVWVDRIQLNGLLVGVGDNYPNLILYSKGADVKVGDFVLAGENFGIGSSREQAAQVLKELGVAAVIAKSFGGIFYRNAFNLGLPAVVIKKESNIDAGDCIKLELETGRINNQTKGVEIFTEIVPDNLLGLIKTGGLLGQLEKLKNIPIESINEK